MYKFSRVLVYFRSAGLHNFFVFDELGFYKVVQLSRCTGFFNGAHLVEAFSHGFGLNGFDKSLVEFFNNFRIHLGRSEEGVPSGNIESGDTASAIVGTFGREGARNVVVTARGINLPALMLALAEAQVVKDHLSVAAQDAHLSSCGALKRNVNDLEAGLQFILRVRRTYGQQNRCRRKLINSVRVLLGILD